MKITYLDKVAIQNDESIPDINKVTDADMNEIKRVVNNNEEELKTENERLRQDLNGLPQGTSEGENIDITDSADMRFSSFEISGNSKQETVTENLFNNIWEQGLIASETGANVESATMIRSDYVRIYPNHLYNISRSIYNSFMTFRFYDKDKKYLGAQTAEGMMTYSTSDGRMNENESSMTFTILNENVAYMRVTDGSNNLSTKYTLTTEAINPDYPSEVESCGDNVNLLKNTSTTQTINGITFYVYDNGMISVSGKATSTINLLVGTSTLPAGTYILSGCPKNGNTETYKMRAGIGTNGEGSFLANDLGNGGTFTSTEETICNVRIYIYNGQTANYTFCPKIEKGSTTTPYSPYGQGCINEVICNKNILDYDKTSYGFYNSSSIFEGAKVHRISDFIKAESNKQYIASTNRIIGYLYIYEFDINKNFLKRSALTNVKENLITTTNSTKYIRVSYNIDNHIEMTIDKLKEIQAQLEEGSIVTDCEEHKGQVFTIPTQQPMKSINNYGQVIRDTFVKVDGKCFERHNIFRKIFNGTEAWSYDNSTKIFSINLTDMIAQTFYNLTETPPVYSSHYTMGSWNDYRNINNGACVLCYGWTYTAFRIRDDRFTTVDAFKAYLSEQYNAGTPVYFDYILATPNDIECTPEQTAILNEVNSTAKTYKGTTHIYSTDNVDPNVEVRYFKDIEIMMNK